MHSRTRVSVHLVTIVNCIIDWKAISFLYVNKQYIGETVLVNMDIYILSIFYIFT